MMVATGSRTMTSEAFCGFGCLLLAALVLLACKIMIEDTVGKGTERDNRSDVANARTTDVLAQEPVALAPLDSQRKSYAQAAKEHLPRMKVRFGSVMSRIAAPLTLRN
jgi:hypothetical protein